MGYQDPSKQTCVNLRPHGGRGGVRRTRLRIVECLQMASGAKVEIICYGTQLVMS